MPIKEELPQEHAEATRIIEACQEAYGPLFTSFVAALFPSLKLETPVCCCSEANYENIFSLTGDEIPLPRKVTHYALVGNDVKPVSEGDALFTFFPVKSGLLLTVDKKQLMSKLAPIVPEYAARVIDDVQEDRLQMLSRWRYLLSRKLQSLLFGYYSVNTSGIITRNDESYPAFNLSLRELMQNVSGEYGDYVLVSGGRAYTPEEVAHNEALILSQAQLAPSENALIGALQTRAAYEATVKGL